VRCLWCAGRGWVRNEADNREQVPAIPCPLCGGSGWDHCCEGSDASCEVILAEPMPAVLDNRAKEAMFALATR
jgi:hypothetical protein